MQHTGETACVRVYKEETDAQGTKGSVLLVLNAPKELPSKHERAHEKPHVDLVPAFPGPNTNVSVRREPIKDMGWSTPQGQVRPTVVYVVGAAQLEELLEKFPALNAHRASVISKEPAEFFEKLGANKMLPMWNFAALQRDWRAARDAEGTAMLNDFLMTLWKRHWYQLLTGRDAVGLSVVCRGIRDDRFDNEPFRAIGNDSPALVVMRENGAHAAHRELFEEAGTLAQEMRYVATDYGRSGNRVYVYDAAGISYANGKGISVDYEPEGGVRKAIWYPNPRPQPEYNPDAGATDQYVYIEDVRLYHAARIRLLMERNPTKTPDR